MNNNFELLTECIKEAMQKEAELLIDQHLETIKQQLKEETTKIITKAITNISYEKSVIENNKVSIIINL